MAPRSTNRSRARQNPKNRSLNAFAIASSQVSEKPAVAAHRLGQAPPKAGKKRSRKDDDEDDDGDEEPRKRGGRDDESIEGGSDSDGGQWKVGVGSGDESDIDSDEAMGESDEERFAGFTFRGSSSKGKTKKKGVAKDMDLDENEGEDEDDESAEDGEGFIDLSEMLDRAESGSDNDQETTKKPKPKPRKRVAPIDSELDDDDSMSSADDEPSDGGDSDADSFTKFSEEDDTPEDPTKLAALRSLITSLPSSTSQPAAKRVRLDDPNEGKTPNEYNLSLSSASQKLTVEDLIPTITDAHLKKSLKVLTDTTPAGTKKSGVQGKLSAPLAKRQQDKLDRAAAYEKTNETLGRWVDTVKHNREAEHLHFPLANALNAPIQAPARIPTMTATNATPLTALEATISGILKDSNMTSEKQIAEFETLKTNKLSIEEVQKRNADLRMARELLYREELKAKRIKKIKSKAYRRIHKKERMRQEEAIEEALVLERGGVPDEEETMERERKRAEERMTLRHKQSKWANGMKESGRTIWDEEVQDGAIDMARRSDELKRRISGKGVQGESSEEEESSSEEEEDEFDEEGLKMRQKLLKDIEKAEAAVNAATAASGSKKLGARLMEMKFMQNAEAAKKKENNSALEELRRSLEDEDKISGDEPESDVEHIQQNNGRMSFKPSKKDIQPTAPKTDKSEFEEMNQSGSEVEEDEEHEDITFTNKATITSTAPKNPFPQPNLSIGKAGGKHPPFSKHKDSSPAPGNPWASNDSNASLVKPKQQVLLSGKQERKGERTNHKLAKDRKSTLKSPAENEEVEIDATVTFKAVPKKVVNPDDDGDEGDDREINLIPRKGGKGANHNQRELVKRAFAGDNVVADFAKEKKKVVEDEGDQVTDDFLPGWGRWVGEGAANNKPVPQRFLKTVKGIGKDKRKDAKLAKVIINEKRVKKVLNNSCSLFHLEAFVLIAI